MYKISKISLKNGNLLVYPAVYEPVFAFVYRAAKEVSWSELQAAFITPINQRDPITAWHELKLVVYEELGLTLIITLETEFTGFRPDSQKLIS